MSDAQPTTSTAHTPETLHDAHELRITSHGKIKSWVEFALNFFESNETRPLTFHTLPMPNRTATSAERVSKGQSALLVPRLISVVEIVKREFLGKLDTSMTDKGALSGLYQYNELGHAESCDEQTEVNAETTRRASLADALKGKNFPQLKKRVAYMKVTLSRTHLPHLAATRGITSQQPGVRTLSKTAKARAKKRLKKERALPAMSCVKPPKPLVCL